MSAYKLNKYQEKWLKALESGKYRRATGQLKEGRGYCCLGVACRVVGLQAVRTVGGYWGFGEDKEDAVAPCEVMEALGFHDEEGAIKNGDFIEVKGQKHYSLAGANDAGASFKSIAKAIRANPENFFR